MISLFGCSALPLRLILHLGGLRSKKLKPHCVPPQGSPTNNPSHINIYFNQLVHSGLTQHTGNVEPTLFYCWADISDCTQTFIKHCVNMFGCSPYLNYFTVIFKNLFYLKAVFSTGILTLSVQITFV